MSVAHVPHMTYRSRVLATRTAVLAVLIGGFETAARTGFLDRTVFVAPTEMIVRLGEQLASGEIFADLRSTLSLILISLVLAAISGVPMGLVLWQFPTLHRLANPYLVSYYALPVFAFYPALIAIFGLNAVPVILLAWAWAVVAVIVGTVTGLVRIRPIYRKVAELYGMSRRDAAIKIYFPAAAPSIFGGLKLAGSYSIIGVVAAEFILAPQGLGYLVSFNYNNFRVLDMYTALLIIILMAVTLTSLLSAAERAVGGKR